MFDNNEIFENNGIGEMKNVIVVVHFILYILFYFISFYCDLLLHNSTYDKTQKKKT